MIPLILKRVCGLFLIVWFWMSPLNPPVVEATPSKVKIFALSLPADGKKHIASKVYISFPYQTLDIPISKLAERKLDESEKILNAFLQSVLKNDSASGKQYMLPVVGYNLKEAFDYFVKRMKGFQNIVVAGKIILGNNDTRFVLKGTKNGEIYLKLIPLYRDKNGVLSIRIAGFFHTWEALLKIAVYDHLKHPSAFPLHSENIFDRFLYPHLKYQFSRNPGNAFPRDRYNPSLETERIPVTLHFQGKLINGNALNKKDMSSDPYLRFFRQVHQNARFRNKEGLLSQFTPKSRKLLETQNMELEARGIHRSKYVIFFISADPFGIVFTADRPIKKLADIDKLNLNDHYIYRNQRSQYFLTNYRLAFSLQQIIIGPMKGIPFFDDFLAPELKKNFKK